MITFKVSRPITWNTASTSRFHLGSHSILTDGFFRVIDGIEEVIIIIVVNEITRIITPPVHAVQRIPE
jgi:hypothetical protein